MKTRSSGAPTAAARGRKRACRAIIHDAWCDDAPVMDIKKWKKGKTEIINMMRNADPPVLSKCANLVCTGCVEMFEHCSNVGSKKQSSTLTMSTSSNNTSGIVIEGDSSETDHADSSVDGSSDLGAGVPEESSKPSFTQLMVDDIKELSMCNKIDIDLLTNYKPSAWLKERPEAVVKHVSDLFGYDFNAVFYEEKKAVTVARAIENMYSARNRKLILPQTFRENLLVYNVSGSKLLVNYFGSLSAGGSYSSLLNAINTATSLPLPVPSGILRVIIDNEQVVGKRYKVGLDNRVPMSVVTSKIYIRLNESEDVQTNVCWKPRKWLFRSADHSLGHSKEQEQEVSSFFRFTRNEFISERLHSVSEQWPLGIESDFIDQILQEEALCSNETLCDTCGAENAATSRKCTSCGEGNLLNRMVDYERFLSNKAIYSNSSFQFCVDTQENSCKIFIGEPELENPNSYESLSAILRNIGKEAGVKRYGGSKRDWLYMECDGGIYPIISQLILNVILCSKCESAFYGEGKFRQHDCPGKEDMPDHEFDWLVLLPGLLHLEMNGARAFLELGWITFLADVAQSLSFTSIRAMEYARKGSDHHKCWEMLEILYIAATDEMLVPFVKHCREKQITPSYEAYWQWFDTVVKDPNYMFIQQLILTFLHAIMLFRDGVRKGNGKVMQVAKAKMSPIFFGRHHPTYQKILAWDNLYMQRMPPEMKQEVLETLSLSGTGRIGHYQGGDAVLEEVNKDAKSWTPDGVPTNRQWQRIFRSLDALNKIRENTMYDSKDTLLNISTTRAQEEDTLSSVNPAAVAKVRALFRKHGYLLHPETFRPLTNLKGDIRLNEDLTYFTNLAKERMEGYMQHFLTDDAVVVKPIFITDAERRQSESIESQTKDQIRAKIIEKLHEIEASDLLREHFRKSVSKLNKADYVEFYYELEQM